MLVCVRSVAFGHRRERYKDTCFLLQQKQSSLLGVDRVHVSPMFMRFGFCVECSVVLRVLRMHHTCFELRLGRGCRCNLFEAGVNNMIKLSFHLKKELSVVAVKLARGASSPLWRASAKS
jgi:hypothetical protein